MRNVIPIILFLLMASSPALSEVMSYTPRAVETQSQRITASDQSEALVKKAFPKRAGIVFMYDDADSSFLNHAVHVSDSLAAANADSVVIKLTTAFMVSLTAGGGVSTPNLSWSELQSLDRSRYEIALHNNIDERLGSRNTGYHGGMTDSMLSAWQDSMRTHGLEPATTMVLGNHRFHHGVENSYISNGINQIYGTSVSIAMDTSSTGGFPQSNEHIPTNINYDPWPASSANTGNFKYNSYMRQGGIKNRWAPIARTLYDQGSPMTADSVKSYINLAIQTGDIYVFAFHKIIAGVSDGININEDEYREIMIYAEHMLKGGYIESYTAEEAAARGTGYVYGNLLPHHNFSRLIDIVPTLADTLLNNSSLVPLMWPIDNGNLNFYTSSLDIWGDAADHDSIFKVHSIADNDTIQKHFLQEGLNADSTSYGASSPTGRVILAKATPSSDRSIPLSIIIPITGVNANYIDLFVDVMYVRGTSGGSFLSFKMFPYGELWNDAVNSGAAAYDFMPTPNRNGPIDSTRLASPDRARIYPLFKVGSVDTNWINHTSGFGDDTAGLYDRFGRSFLRPFITEDQSTWDMRTPYGNWKDIDDAGGSAAPFLIDVPAARDLNIASEMNFGQAYWITYHARIEIMPMMTDWVSGFIHFRTDGTAFDVPPSYIIGNIQAVAPI